jgi:hypothetical protein
MWCSMKDISGFDKCDVPLLRLQHRLCGLKQLPWDFNDLCRDWLVKQW